VRVRALWRHPVKGHGVEAVAATTLAPGRTMPWDRVWAIAHEAARVEPGATAWANCANFGRGAKSPELMAIRAEVDEAAGRLRLTHPRRPAIEVDPDDPDDAARLVAWVTPLSNPSRPAPAFVVKGDVGMTDSPFPSISILNTAGLATLGERLGKPLAMERFRGNVWLDGLAPFAELDLVGRDIRLGEAVATVRARITRCVATTVDPDTGRSDADTLGALEAGWGHRDFGVYAEVTEGGRVAVGDPAVVL
jgi:uncharacterized protein YcbX